MVDIGARLNGGTRRKRIPPASIVLPFIIWESIWRCSLPLSEGDRTLMRRKLISDKGSIASVLINVGIQVALSIATGIKLTTLQKI